MSCFTETKDILRGLAIKYNLKSFIDDAISQRITLRLANLSVHEALRVIAKERGLNMTLEDNICKIALPEIPKPQPKPFTNLIFNVSHFCCIIETFKYSRSSVMK